MLVWHYAGCPTYAQSSATEVAQRWCRRVALDAATAAMLRTVLLYGAKHDQRARPGGEHRRGGPS